MQLFRHSVAIQISWWVAALPKAARRSLVLDAHLAQTQLQTALFPAVTQGGCVLVLADVKPTLRNAVRQRLFLGIVVRKARQGAQTITMFARAR